MLDSLAQPADAIQHRGILMRGLSQCPPVTPAAAADNVIHGGEGKILMVEMAVLHRNERTLTVACSHDKRCGLLVIQGRSQAGFTRPTINVFLNGPLIGPPPRPRAVHCDRASEGSSDRLALARCVHGGMLTTVSPG